MKKIILTAVALIGFTATAQVKVGADVQNLAAGANFQVEGTAPENQFIVFKDGRICLGATSIPNPNTTVYFSKNNPAGVAELRIRNTAVTGSSLAQLSVSSGDQDVYLYTFGTTYPTTHPMYQPSSSTLDADNSFNISVANGGVFKIFTSSTGPINGLEKFTLLNNGNVGIGNNSPASLLHIGNATNSSSNLLVEGLNFNVVIGKHGATGFAGIPTDQQSTIWTNCSVPMVVGTNQSQPIVFATSTSEKMRIASNGNVSIVTTPTITTATKVLVKEAVTNIISEQVVALGNMPVLNTTAVNAMNGEQVVTPNGGGTIVYAPDGLSKWRISVSNTGVITTTKIN